MTTVAELIQLVRYQLHDQDKDCYRWSDEELLDYLNAGTKEIVSLVPEANVVEALFTCTDNVPLQQIPAGGIKFIKATSNSGAGNVKTGGIRYCEKDVLDTYDPDWYYTGPSADANRKFEHYMHDPRDQSRFYLYPRPTNGDQLWIEFSRAPDNVSTKNDFFPLRVQYEKPACEYMYFRAMTKEGRYSQAAEAQRTRLWDNFLESLGLSRRTSREVSPEQHRPPDSSAS